MLKQELINHANSYNNLLSRLSYNMPDTSDIKTKIADLKNEWDTTGGSSHEVIGSLERKCEELDTALNDLKSAIDSLKSQNMAFNFTEDKDEYIYKNDKSIYKGE